MESFVSVYVDMSASPTAVRTAVEAVPHPDGVTSVAVDDRSVSDTFGCRIAIDLVGDFDEKREGLDIARRYAAAVSAKLGVPAFYDLLRLDSPGRFLQ